jgi:hypothetical protein
VSASQQLARLSAALQLAPSDLLAAPPLVLDELFEIAHQQSQEAEKAERKRAHEERLAKLRGM